MQRAIPNVTKQMLTNQERGFEGDDLIARTVFPEVPPRVEFALTQRGRLVLPVISEMRDWDEAGLS